MIKSVQLIILSILVALIPFASKAQTQKGFSSLKMALGVSINETKQENGGGFVFAIGLQKVISKNEKLRINPNLIIGEYRDYANDVRDKYYRLTGLNLMFNYDLIKVRSFSMISSIGGFLNYTRGLLGTGGSANYSRRSEYFDNFYLGGEFALSFQYSVKNEKISFGLTPLNIQIGNNQFVSSTVTANIQFKLLK